MKHQFDISNEKLDQIYEALVYLKMQELRDLLIHLSLPSKGKKNLLIKRIFCFMKTGEIIETPLIPKSAHAPKRYKRKLAPEEPIYYKSYKSDLESRLFFKQLIGEHFHFTAFGNDWLTEKWLRGQTPTYQEYADFWQFEMTKRANSPADPKKEWAYLNFCQHYLKQYPNASRTEMVKAWETKRQTMVDLVHSILGTS